MTQHSRRVAHDDSKSNDHRSHSSLCPKPGNPIAQLIKQFDGCAAYQQQAATAMEVLIEQHELLTLELHTMRNALAQQAGSAHHWLSVADEINETHEASQTEFLKQVSKETKPDSEPSSLFGNWVIKREEESKAVEKWKRQLSPNSDGPESLFGDNERKNSTNRLDDHPLLPDMIDGALNLRDKVKSGQGPAGTRRRYSNSIVMGSRATILWAVDHPFRGEVRTIVEKPQFDLIIGMAVIVSVMSIGVEVEYMAHSPDGNLAPFIYVQAACCFLFVFEVVMRIVAYDKGYLGFGDGPRINEWKWNVFDLLSTASMIADVVVSLNDEARTGGAKHGQLVRLFRLMRIIRALKFVRGAEYARELRKMSYALQYSVCTLLWSLLLLCFIMYFFATIFTMATTEKIADYKSGILPEKLVELRSFYGTIPRSFQSLFEAITSGRDWNELTAPLVELHWINMVLFFVYISLTVFGVMNVITSVFVESALASARHYKDLLIQDNMKEKQIYLQHLQDVFKKIDYDNSGEISLEEMETFLVDPYLQQYLESMDIKPDDARTLFKLLDVDNSDQVNIDEFCQGCLRLKGEAKSFDIHCMLYENTRLLHKWQHFMDYQEKVLFPKLVESVEMQHANSKILKDGTASATSRQSWRGLRSSFSDMRTSFSEVRKSLSKIIVQEEPNNIDIAEEHGNHDAPATSKTLELKMVEEPRHADEVASTPESSNAVSEHGIVISLPALPDEEEVPALPCSARKEVPALPDDEKVNSEEVQSPRNPRFFLRERTPL